MTMTSGDARFELVQQSMQLVLLLEIDAKVGPQNVMP